MSALLACALAFGPQPIFRIGPEAVLPVAGAKLMPGTAVINTPHGTGLDFDGERGGIEIPDAPLFHLTGSVSVSCWINLRSYVTPHSSAGGAQIVFRGDDHFGRDPYHLTVLADRTIAFAVEDISSGAHVNAPVDLRRWTHVVGSFDERSGALRLYLDGKLAAFSTTKVRPFRDLDPAARPGIGIGNVQAASGGAHNQPLNGQLCDLRLYNTAVTPHQTGYGAMPSRGRTHIMPIDATCHSSRAAGPCAPGLPR